MIKRSSLLFAAICLTSNSALGQDIEALAEWDEATAIEGFNACYLENRWPSALEICNFTKACTENSPMGSKALGVYRCLKKDTKLWDEKLNFEYEKLLKHLSPWVHNNNDPVEGLRKAQRAWIIFREADCQSQMERSPLTGAYAGGAYVSCTRDMTAKRALEFRSQNQWHESR